VRLPANKRVLVFFAILLAIGAWIAVGMLTREPVAVVEPPERPRTAVAATWSEAQPVERLLTLYGDIEPDQAVIVRAETAGQVAEVIARRGAEVEPGDVVARLGMDDRMARMRRAEAQVAGEEGDYEAARQLAEQGHAPQLRVDTALAELEAARAELEAIQLEIENTTIRAPIEGVVNRVIAERGHYVGIGGEVAEIIDNDPLVAVVQVPQHAIARVSAGGPARVSVIGREPLQGTVRFIAPLAEAATRTFRVEIELPNPERSLPSGISAEVIIPTATVMAHKVSPAIVSLDEQGVVGIKTVDEEGLVAFHPIELVRAEPDGVWVTGVPEQARLITVGQGFVSAGEQVEVREVPGEAELVERIGTGG
jgi:membrane fusion protein, multidrug efflux system